MTTKERPILFSGPMVRAILGGRKTQTRRIVKSQPDCKSWCLAEIEAKRESLRHDSSVFKWAPCYGSDETPNGEDEYIHCPYGKPGDRLRISEEVTVKPLCEDWFTVLYHADRALVERPCDPGLMQRIKNYKTGHLRGVSLPPAYARPDRLIITGVRVERLQDISEADAMAEGCDRIDLSPREINGMQVHPLTSTYFAAFSELWCSINGPESWAANPWAWVVEFRRCEQ
jgi:hypothetical protein